MVPRSLKMKGRLNNNIGFAVVQLIETLHYKPSSCGFDFRFGSLEFFH